MTGFPGLLLLVGLLAVAYCLLHEHGYIGGERFPVVGGWRWWLKGRAERWGIMVQWCPAGIAYQPTKRVQWAGAWLVWPRTLILRPVPGLCIFLYLGGRSKR